MPEDEQMKAVNPKQETDPQDDIDPFADSKGRTLVLEAMGVEEKDEVLLAACKIIGFSIEAKAGEYQSTRGYVRIEPENLWIYVPIYDPAKAVDDNGNVGVFNQVFKLLANQLDMDVVEVAHRRADRAIVEADREAKTAPKNRRFGGKEGATAKKTDDFETL